MTSRRGVEISEAAKADIADIHAHIANDSPQNADLMVARILKTVGRLARFPYTGRPRPELGRDTRGLVEWPYVILYKVRVERVEIARVLNGVRNIAALIKRSKE